MYWSSYLSFTSHGSLAVGTADMRDGHLVSNLCLLVLRMNDVHPARYLNVPTLDYLPHATTTPPDH